MKWNPILGEFLMARLEVENEFGKFAVVVKKCDVVVEHLSKASQIRKIVNLGDGEIL